LLLFMSLLLYFIPPAALLDKKPPVKMCPRATYRGMILKQQQLALTRFQF